MTPAASSSQRFWLLAIFVLSGFAGLIYQSIWSHYLGLFLGHAAYAQALVLAIFMGGMAAGAAWIARAGQRWRNLVRCYAIIEAVIGVFGLVFHWLFGAVTAFGYDWLMPAVGAPWAVDMARWGLAAVLILPQTILLGMTFPLMSGGLIRRFPGADGSLLGGLYFTNSIGAAFGALVAVFVLLPWGGLPGAMNVAGALNFVVAALAWYLAREPEPAAPCQIAPAQEAQQSLANSPLLRVVLIGTALSGAASFAYEIIWIRMLAIAVGSTMHAFELMLASFVAGIALGGLWVRHRADRAKDPLHLVGWMQVCMGICALASLFVYANAFAWVGWLMEALARTDGGYALYNLGTASIAMAIMLPAAFFAGTTLPLFTVVLLRAGHGERAIGRVYAWNTLGAIAGVFASIHVLIPVLGVKLALCLAALVDMAIGLVLLHRQADVEAARRWMGAPLAGGLVAVALILAVRVQYDPVMLASGVFRYGTRDMDGIRVPFYRDGKTASVSVMQLPNGMASIVTNGKPDAAISMREGSMRGSDESTMVLLAALPLALADRVDNIGVIGFGSGMTTHNLLHDQRVRRVETVEIERAMIDGARAFGHKVANAYTDPRSHIILDDAKAYFSGQGKKFDIIISEPSNPWISGVGSLFTREFYQFVPRHLNEGGLFVQWLQLYEIDDALIGSVLQALVPEFEDYAAWISNDGDLIIVARPEGQLGPLDFSRLDRAQPLLQDLQGVNMPQQAHVAWQQVLDAPLLRTLAAQHSAFPANSDYSLLLGLHAPRTRFKREGSMIRSLPMAYTRLLEALEISVPLPAQTPITLPNHFPVTEKVDEARSTLGDFLLDTPKQPDNLVLHTLNREICTAANLPEEKNRWIAFAWALFEGTTPFLPADALGDFWSSPAWPQCANLGSVLALFDSHARRDWVAMESLGKAWLQEASRPEALDEVALLGILLAQVRQQRWQDVLDQQAQLEAVQPGGLYRQQMDLMLALARHHLGQQQP